MPHRLPVPPYFVLMAITGATKNQPGIATNSSPGIGEAKFSLSRLKNKPLGRVSCTWSVTEEYCDGAYG